MKPLLFFLLLLILNPLQAQKKKETVSNDMNTPLHLLQPEYNVPYGITSIEDVTADLERVLNYLEESTPARVIHRETRKEITDYSQIDNKAILEPGVFRLTSYEWGVTYSAMLASASATGNKAFREYVDTRFSLLAETAPYFRQQMIDHGIFEPQMKSLLTPHALDDAGAMCAAMIKAQQANTELNLQDIIDNYINYIMYNEHRLSDGTFARNRPQANTLWLDDLFMSVPAIVQMGRLTGEAKYYNEAARQIRQFSQRMFLPEKGLYRHGWVEGASSQPTFHWARANGWAILTLTEVLDVLPRNHPEYEPILEQYRSHIQGIANCQSGEGFWHQLLDRNDSYLETSATAIFVYCLAHGINNGWIDPIAYGPVAQLGWNAVSTQINSEGQVEGTCVGTGMGFDPAFYYHRPVNKYAAHGYGPVLLAGAEMINLLNKFYPKMNDSALQYYRSNQTASSPIFSVGAIVAGNTRVNPNRPVIFTIGDSTMKNGSGRGDNKQWGWGTFFDFFVDTTRISVENHAIGGRSSRTFITEGRWDRVLAAIRPGDYLIVQFGHNDGGPLNTGRARASLRGTGEESQTVIMERHGGPEKIYTYGHYMRIYVRQAKARGANVIVMSPTPGNSWDENNKMYRNHDTYGKWSKEIAEQENIPYIDLNDRIALKFEAMGKDAAAAYFIDRVHTSFQGAILNAKAAAEGILQLDNCDLKKYILPESLTRDYTEKDISPR